MAQGSGSGGVSPGGGKKKKKGQKKTGKYYTVPYGSYDPSIAAQQRAAERGLDDLRFDTKVAGKWAQKDLSQTLGDIGRRFSQGRRDTSQDYRRARTKIDLRRGDLQKDAARGREDFATRLAGIGRDFANLGNKQKQASNVAGTLHGGTAAASAAKRRANQALATAPIKTAARRAEEDLTSNLGRLETSRRQLGQDVSKSLNRGLSDYKRSTKLTKRDASRGKFDRYHKLQRGIREQQEGKADLEQQKIYSARQNNPGVFGKYGRKKKK